jgi:hypothetical protein
MAGKPVHAGVATLVPEMKIGVADGATEYMFGEVGDIAVGRDGSIYVLDNKVPSIRQFDGKGAYVRTLGRKGQGPGEYESPGGIAVHPDGRVLLWDAGNWRVNVYAPTGEPAAHWPIASGLPRGGTGAADRAVIADATGVVLVRRTIPTAGQMRPVTVWLRLRADGALIDTVRQPASPSPYRPLEARGPSSGVSMGVPFVPSQIWLWSPLGYLVTAYPSTYAVDLRIPIARPETAGARGPSDPPTWTPNDPVVSIRRDVRAVPITAADAGAERKRVEQSMRRIDPSWTWTGPDIPKFKPAYESLIIGSDGRIWVRLDDNAPFALPSPTRAAAKRTHDSLTAAAKASGRRGPVVPGPSAPIEYDVFEPNGTYLGQVETPFNVSTFVRTGDFVYGVTYNEDDIPFVTKFRIAWK